MLTAGSDGAADVVSGVSAVVQVLPYLHIFSADALTDAKRKHVLANNRDPFLYMSMGCRNTSRGRDIASGTTTVYPPAQSAANAGMQSPLRRTNGHAPRTHGSLPGPAPPHGNGRARASRTDVSSRGERSSPAIDDTAIS